MTDDPAPLTANVKVLQHPVKVTLEGFVFLDFAPLHSSCKNKNSDNWCDRNGGRGVTKNHGRRTRGCYEVHPVLAVHAG